MEGTDHIHSLRLWDGFSSKAFHLELRWRQMSSSEKRSEYWREQDWFVTWTTFWRLAATENDTIAAYDEYFGG